MSKGNGTIHSGVGEMGVGKMGVGKMKQTIGKMGIGKMWVGKIEQTVWKQYRKGKVCCLVLNQGISRVLLVDISESHIIFQIQRF